MRLVAWLLAVLLLSSSAFAQTGAPLPPGKPAGVHAGALHTTENVILISMMAVGVGVAALLVAHAKAPASSAISTSP
jgi:hypothetical protein